MSSFNSFLIGLMVLALVPQTTASVYFFINLKKKTTEDFWLMAFSWAVILLVMLGGIAVKSVSCTKKEG